MCTEHDSFCSEALSPEALQKQVARLHFSDFMELRVTSNLNSDVSPSFDPHCKHLKLRPIHRNRNGTFDQYKLVDHLQLILNRWKPCYQASDKMQQRFGCSGHNCVEQLNGSSSLWMYCSSRLALLLFFLRWSRAACSTKLSELRPKVSSRLGDYRIYPHKGSKVSFGHEIICPLIPQHPLLPQSSRYRTWKLRWEAFAFYNCPTGCRCQCVRICGKSSSTLSSPPFSSLVTYLATESVFKLFLRDGVCACLFTVRNWRGYEIRLSWRSAGDHVWGQVAENEQGPAAATQVRPLRV